MPYTGVMPIEATIDHAGPMTGTVADNALLLEVIAGADGLDPRQYNVRVDKYTAALGRGVAGLRIGVLTEGFRHRRRRSPTSIRKCAQAADRFRALGAIVEEVSIPMHLDGPAIWTPIALEGLQAQMMHGNGMGFNWEGLYTTSLLDAHANWRARANQLSRTLKISMLAGEYFIRTYRGHFYAKAQNLSRLLQQDLRRRAVAPRPAADADDADEGDADPAAGRAAVAVLPARVRDAAQHLPVRRQRPPGDEHPVRHVGGAAGGHAAGRRALQRVDDLPRRARLRAARRLAQLLTPRTASSDVGQPVPLRLAERRPDDRLRPQGTQSYVSGPTDEPLRFLTISAAARQDGGRHGSRDAAIFEAESLRLSWYDLKRKADELAAGLLALGLRRGNRVGIWAPNRHEWVVTQFATARIGLILVNINPAYRKSELEYALNKVGCRALVMARRYKSSDYLGMLGDIAPEIHFKGASEVLDSVRLPSLKHVVLLDDEPVPPRCSVVCAGCSRSAGRRSAAGSTR